MYEPDYDGDMADERKWRLGDDVGRNDSLLDGITFDDIILAAHCNCKEITPEEVRREFRELLEIRMADAEFLLENNMDEIIAEAKKGREGQ